MPLFRKKIYEVVATRSVAVDFPDGNAVNYPHGHRFEASPSNRCVVRLLRNNSIREVTPRELGKADA